MIRITIAEWMNNEVISSCDMFVENEYGTIANLRTDKEHLKQGFAKRIMTAAVKVAEGLGLKSVSLRVLKGSFMREWYIRLGYGFFAEDAEDEQYEWLEKLI